MLFIIGASGSGKTTLTNLFYYRDKISASGWIESKFPEEYKNRLNDKSRKDITKKSLDSLKEDPNICINYIRNHNLNYNDFIIDGIRNPRDFISLFDCNKDTVIFLRRLATPAANSFETGIYVIENYINWLISNNLLSEKSFIKCITLNNKCDIECIPETWIGCDEHLYACCLDRLSIHLKKII